MSTATQGASSASSEAEGTASGAPARGRGRAAARRVCSVCGERLSSYNPGPDCYAHTVDIPWRGPSNRPR